MSIFEKAGNILRASELNANIKYNINNIANLKKLENESDNDGEVLASSGSL